MCNCLFLLFERLHFLVEIDCLPCYFIVLVRGASIRIEGKNILNFLVIWPAVAESLNWVIPRYWIKDLAVAKLLGFVSLVDVVSYISAGLIPHYCCCEDVFFFDLRIFWMGCDSLALHLLIYKKSKVCGAIALTLSGSGTGTGHFCPDKQRFIKCFSLWVRPVAVPIEQSGLPQAVNFEFTQCRSANPEYPYISSARLTPSPIDIPL